MSPVSAPQRLVENFFRQQWRNSIAGLVVAYGLQHIDDIEDAVQSAMGKALDRWAYSGVPDNPGGWIYRAARNALLDDLRRKRTRDNHADAVVHALYGAEQPPSDTVEDPLSDDALKMILVCSHPSIRPRDSITLTLRVVCGLGFGEIAAALCMGEEAVRKSLLRCKAKLAGMQHLIDEPIESDCADRLGRVLRTVYLLFNEGYLASHGDTLTRRDLCLEAERLMALLRRSRLASDNRIWALSALVALQSSRLDARTDDHGRIVLLSQQDRSRWDQGAIARGMAFLQRSLGAFERSPYHLEAAIAACHLAAPSYAETDWERIIGYFDELLEMNGSPVVRMNRAVAVMQARGADAALEQLQPLEERADMKHNRLLASLLAECHRRRGDVASASTYYAQSIARSSNRVLSEYWAAQETGG